MSSEWNTFFLVRLRLTGRVINYRCQHFCLTRLLCTTTCYLKIIKILQYSSLTYGRQPPGGGENAILPTLKHRYFQITLYNNNGLSSACRQYKMQICILYYRDQGAYVFFLRNKIIVHNEYNSFDCPVTFQFRNFFCIRLSTTPLACRPCFLLFCSVSYGLNINVKKSTVFFYQNAITLAVRIFLDFIHKTL